jgi:sugar/nucleoside kinase (ribokinase family)
MPLYDEIWNMEGRECIPGGSALNTARGCNYMLKSFKNDNKTEINYYGCVGKDAYGELL